mmetsp:Transcript_25918/g.62513  ORF Transcript_25918/g.62513 Transcript_25918/m.62513 type:complete len:332 (-) Transcript_25918:91-1086(-)
MWGSKPPPEPSPPFIWLPLGDWWSSVEQNHKGQRWIDMTREHAEVPIFAVAIYLGVVFYLPGWLQGTKPLRLKRLFAGWNLLLAVFSLLGSLRTMPVLIHFIRRKGFHFTVCTDPQDWYLDGPVGLWVGLFIFSKIPELLDTAFLVLQQKRVIFLHWFHHCTVMLYCWHAYHNRVAPGLWFAAMNFVVHSVMYTYYFAMAAKMSYVATPIAPFITTVQILQMGVGSFVTFSSAKAHSLGGDQACFVDAANYKLGLAMYGSYLILFVGLFSKKYFGKKLVGSDGLLVRKDQICGVEVKTLDTTGRFQDFNRNKSENNSPMDTAAAFRPKKQQ